VCNLVLTSLVADLVWQARLLAQPDVFVVERLLAERITGSGAKRRKQFLVHWEGYGENDLGASTWEDADSILDVRFIDLA
jgi:hypothetical protein